jgi:hypothetical protein
MPDVTTIPGMSQPLWLAPLLATVVLLAATFRTWRSRRGWVEGVGLAASLGLADVFLQRLGPALAFALLPIGALGATGLTLAYAEWRFAPDFGQRGWRWATTGSAQATFCAALGLGIVHGAVAALGPDALPAAVEPGLMLAAALVAIRLSRFRRRASVHRDSPASLS